MSEMRTNPLGDRMLDFLLDPNIAYILLVFGSMLLILAALNPGSGILELGAVFLLLLAGWGIYNLSVNVWALVLLLIGIISIVLAVRPPGRRVMLWVSILALVTGSSFMFKSESWQPAVNPWLALVLSTLSAGSLWIIATKVLVAAKTQPTHDLNRLIGEIGEAKTDILYEGTVQVAGEQWTARSETLIQNGSRIQVIGRDGLILLVEPYSKIKS